MAIRFDCTCGRPLEVGDELAGKKARCPFCRNVVEVPASTPTVSAGSPLRAHSRSRGFLAGFIAAVIALCAAAAVIWTIVLIRGHRDSLPEAPAETLAKAGGAPEPTSALQTFTGDAAYGNRPLKTGRVLDKKDQTKAIPPPKEKPEESETVLAPPTEIKPPTMPFQPGTLPTAVGDKIQEIVLAQLRKIVGTTGPSKAVREGTALEVTIDDQTYRGEVFTGFIVYDLAGDGNLSVKQFHVRTTNAWKLGEGLIVPADTPLSYKYGAYEVADMSAEAPEPKTTKPDLKPGAPQ